MVEDICKMKTEILQQAEKELQERGPERMDVDRLGEMVDMVKDLAEAEKLHWESYYYQHAVTEAMEKKYGSRSPYSSESDDIVEKLGNEYRKLSPEDKMTMKTKVLAKFSSM